MSHDRYSKFIRGKDLSSKSAHDMSCVLGRRSRKRRKGDLGGEEDREGHSEDKVNEGTSPHITDQSMMTAYDMQETLNATGCLTNPLNDKERILISSTG